MEHKVAASIDSLTGIANRRAFLETAVRALKQRTRTPQPVSALLFDLDRFKSINDRYGHAVGDRVLRAFADVAAVELRSTDLLGRLGGEEFGAVLFGAEASSAAATAERIRRNFASMPLGNGDQLGVSVSIGVASVSASEPTEIESLLTRADEALYVAKARGRNRIEIADAYAGRAVCELAAMCPGRTAGAIFRQCCAQRRCQSCDIAGTERRLRPSVVVPGSLADFSAALARDDNDRRPGVRVCRLLKKWLNTSTNVASPAHFSGFKRQILRAAAISSRYGPAAPRSSPMVGTGPFGGGNPQSSAATRSAPAGSLTMSS